MTSKQVIDGGAAFFTPARKDRFKRLAVVICVPLVLGLVLFLILWNTFYHYVPPGRMLVKSSSPAAASTIPRTITPRRPRRLTSRGASDEPVNTDSVIGMNDSPATSAVSPSTCCRYSVIRRNIPG